MGNDVCHVLRQIQDVYYHWPFPHPNADSAAARNLLDHTTIQ